MVFVAICVVILGDGCKIWGPLKRPRTSVFMGGCESTKKNWTIEETQNKKCNKDKQLLKLSTGQKVKT